MKSPVQAQDISDAEDLAAVIALNGKPCGQVVSATKRGEDDYVATCEDGVYMGQSTAREDR